MKKLIVLCSVLSVIGCNQEEVENTPIINVSDKGIYDNNDVLYFQEDIYEDNFLVTIKEEDESDITSFVNKHNLRDIVDLFSNSPYSELKIISKYKDRKYGDLAARLFRKDIFEGIVFTSTGISNAEYKCFMSSYLENTVIILEDHIVPESIPQIDTWREGLVGPFRDSHLETR